MKKRNVLELNRRNLTLFNSEVETVLPDYFKQSYPDLVKFLNYYYDFVQREEPDSFSTLIYDLYQIRDIEQTSLEYLNLLFKEIGGGSAADYFQDPRTIAKLFARFFRVKGSLYSAEGFFRAFYNTEATIEYPKKNIFIVGESEIGPESLKYIQDYRLYQIFSILIKSPIPISTWRTLFKKFVQPAGFFVGGEVVLENSLSITFTAISEILTGAADTTPVFEFTAALEGLGLTEITGVYDDGADSDIYPERLSFNDTVAELVNTGLTIEQLDALYNNIEELLSANSPTFDDDSAVGNKAIKFSNTIETMDEDIFDQGRPPIYNDSV